jgi:6-phosphofructokinase 1
MSTRSARLALVVGGGPAPGINGVISAVTIESVLQGFEVIGFIDGFKNLVTGDAATSGFRRLDIDDVKALHLKGGSVLGTSRTNPTKSEEHMQNVFKVFEHHNIGYLVTIGGDDTAFSGSQVYARAGGRIRVAHVPKTIDNDLPLDSSMPTFGFETARQVGVGVVKNLIEDARTTSRWYIIISMGRAAGHLALGIGKASAATLTIIPEELDNRKIKLDELADIVIGAIIKRRSRNNPYGVAIVAEGLIEKIETAQLEEAVGTGKYGAIIRDPHGHLRLGEIDFGRLVRDWIHQRLEEFKIELTMIDKEIGYELRCADPIPFDAEYTRDLGYGAVKFLLSENSAKFGALISIVGGRLKPLPFQEVLDPVTKRMTTRVVDIKGVGYECARRYMIRLEKTDFTDGTKLARLADSIGWTPEQFAARFGYLVGV